MPTIIPPNDSATSVSFNPYGNIAATNVQAALAELDDEKTPYVDPHYVAAKYFAALNFGALI